MIAEYTRDYLAKSDDWAAKAASEAVELVAKYENLKELGDDLLAELSAQVLDTNEDMTQTEAKLRARRQEEWKEYRKGLREARFKAKLAEVKAKNHERHWKTVQSGLADRREELSRIGG